MTGDMARTTFQPLKRHQAPGHALASKFAGRGEVEVSGQGAWITLSDSRRLLDFGSYAVNLLGHRYPTVVEAVRSQLDRLPISTRSLGNPVTAHAASRLAEYFDGLFPRVYFGLNGADAVEIAVKLARLATGRTTVIAVHGAYHGKSLGALALTHNERFRLGLEPLLPGVRHVDPSDAAAVATVVEEQSVAALLIEPVQGENGVITLDPAIVRRWCEDARATGAFVISDEIQAGLRRCGPRSVAVTDGLAVDAVLIGKPLGGGVLPVSAMLAREAMYEPLIADPFRHSATFSGYPLAAAAVPAALDAIERTPPTACSWPPRWRGFCTNSIADGPT